MLPNGFEDKIIYSFSILLSKLINRRKNPAAIRFKKILVIRQDEIGDLCYSLQVFELLRKKFPETEITLWCKPFAVGLVKNDPNLNKVVDDSTKLDGNYDLIIDLRGGWKGIFYAISHWPKYRLERGIIRLRNKRIGKHPHEMQTNAEIIKEILDQNTAVPLPKIYLSESDSKNAEDFLQVNQLKKFVVFHTEARRVLRKWPAENYISLAIYLKEKYNLDVLFIGDKNDVVSIENLQSKIPFKTFSVAGKFSLSSFAALVPKASLYVGNESGPLHIAALSGIPSIGLYGPGEPDVFYPLGKNTGILHHVLPCNPCNQIDCIHPENPCIRRITIDEVKNKILEIGLGNGEW